MEEMKSIVYLQKIEKTIFMIRGQKIMLSTHLADLYGVEPKVLMQAVKRNIDRFPEDFMFQLSVKEFDNLKSQIVTSSWGGMRRARPYAFTEQGVAMLSSVLRSKRAVRFFCFYFPWAEEASAKTSAISLAGFRLIKKEVIMEFFIFRINKIKIYNNREWGPGEAKILSFITGEDVNNLGKTIDSIIDAPEFDGFTANVLTLAAAATNPAAVAGLAIAKYVFGLVADTMMEKKDDQIGIVYQSFNRFEHYPHGERKKDDVPDLSNNIRFSYSIFGTTY